MFRDLRGGGKGWTLFSVAVGWLLLNGFRVVLPALLPAIKADFTIGNASAGFALTVLWATYAALQFPAGIVADRTGERAVLVAGMVVGTVSLVAFYLAPAFALFLLACAGFGLGAGLYGTPRDMLLSRTFAAADNTAYSVTFAAGSLGAAAMPVVATAIAARTDWRVAIATLVPAFGLLAAGLWRAVPRTRAGDGAGPGPSARETARRTLGALTGRSVVLAGGGMITLIFTYQALIAFLPTYLVEVKGLGEGLAAALFGVLFVVGAVTQPLVGSLADGYGERATMLGLVVVSTATLLALPFTGGVALLVLVPLLGVRIGMGPVTSAYIVRDLPDPVQGTGWGLLRSAFFGIGATGSTVIGVFGDAGLFDAGFLFLAGLTAVIAPFWLLVPSPGRPGRAG